MPTLTIQPGSANRVEGNAGFMPYTFTVRRSGDVPGVSRVDWLVEGWGTAPADGLDFGGTFPGGSLRFARGQRLSRITVLGSGDTLVEPDQEFRVSLTRPRRASIDGDGALGLIRNDDTEPTTTLALKPASLRLNEGDTGLNAIRVTVERFGDLSGSSEVHWSVEGVGANPADRWDLDGNLFPSGSLRFEPGERSRVITVPVLADTAVENDERLRVVLREVSGAALQTGASSAEVTIVNDDSGAWIYDWQQATPLGDVPGVLLAKLALPSPRVNEPDLRISALRVDLSTPGIGLSATDPIINWQAGSRETSTETTRGFISSQRQQGRPVVAAINTAYFSLLDGSRSVPSDLLGLAVSAGTLVSPVDADYPSFLFDPVSGARIVDFKATPTVVPDPAGLQVATSGLAHAGIIVQNGIASGEAVVQNARSALGISRDNRFLTLLTVDRSLRTVLPSITYSGATIHDSAMVLAGLGSHTGLSLDGGGSTTLAWWNPGSDAAELLNAPLGGVERFVGANLGITYQAPGGS